MIQDFVDSESLKMGITDAILARELSFVSEKGNIISHRQIGSRVRSKTEGIVERSQCLSEVASTVKEVQILSNALYKKINFPVSVVYISLYRLLVILSIRLFVSVSLW